MSFMFFFCFLKNIIIVFEDRIRVLKAKSEIFKIKIKSFQIHFKWIQREKSNYDFKI